MAIIHLGRINICKNYFVCISLLYNSLDSFNSGFPAMVMWNI